MSSIRIVILLVFTLHNCLSFSRHVQDVVLTKSEASSFYKRFFDNHIDEECYGEQSCDFEEVIEKFGHSERSYEYWNTYRCNTSNYRCEDVKCRGNPIGMQNKRIPDKNIMASSWQQPFDSFRPEAGRLDNKDGVWCPNTLSDSDKNRYLQIEFPSRYNVCAVATQGSPLYSTDWVKKYRLEFSLEGKKFITYAENGTMKEFTGNTNHGDMVKHDLNRPITAQFIRFFPVEWNYKPCMRVEVYGSAIACPRKTKNDNCCVFPFIYEGEKYYKCIMGWFRNSWCATTSNYDKDKKWEYCLPPSKQ